VRISHCFRRLAKSSNGVMCDVAWLGSPFYWYSSSRPVERPPAERRCGHERCSLRSQRGSRQLDGPQASERYITEPCIVHTVHVCLSSWCPRTSVIIVVRTPRVEDTDPCPATWLGLKGMQSHRAFLLWPHISCQEREAWTESRNRDSHKLTDVRG
jgi:hypothetical protein